MSGRHEPDVERFFRLSIDLLCIANAAGYFVRLSDSWVRVLGYSHAELTSRPFLDFVHPDDRAQTATVAGAHVEGRRLSGFINRYRSVSGEYRTLSWRSSPVDADGLIFAVARDVTDEMAATQRLEEERAQLRAVMDAIPDLVFIKDTNFRYIGCNRPFEGLVDRPESALLGRDDFQVFPPDDAQFFRSHDTAMLATGAPRRNEEWLNFPDGQRRLFDTIKAPYRGSDGRLLGLVGVARDITGRRETEGQLREREALYRAAVESNDDGFWLLDRSGRLLDANSAYARMSGYSVDELRGMNISDFDFLEKEEETAQRIADTLARGAATFETRHRRKDGSVWDVEVNTFYSDIEGGRFFTFLRDLRRRRRAELLLKTRLQLAELGRRGDMDALMDGVLDAAERLTASTVSFINLTDPGRAEEGPQVWRRHYPEHGGPAAKRLLTVPAPGENGFSAVVGLGGKVNDYDQDDIDMVTELCAVAMGAIQWLRAEQTQRELSDALARTARQWTAAMNSFEGGVAVLDRRRRLVRANAAFFTLTASGPDRLGRAMHCLTDLTESDADCPLCDAFNRWEATQLVLEADAPGNPSGLPLELRLSPIHDGMGDSDSMLLSLYDLTRAREQERRMQQTIAELTRSNAELEQFAKVAAHDLQEPTRRQISFAQLLERELAGRINEEARASLDFIIEDARKMRDMVRELNVYVDAGRSLRPTETVDLDAVAADVREALQQEITASAAALHFAPLGRAFGDRTRLQLLLVNLVSNSLKFRRPGVAPHIDVTARADGDWLEMSVSDNGVGIPEEFRADLFSLFRRLKSGPSAPGAGMGLAQCRRIVDDLGGRIWIEGAPDHGAVVKFTLPRPV